MSGSAFMSYYEIVFGPKEEAARTGPLAGVQEVSDSKYESVSHLFSEIQSAQSLALRNQSSHSLNELMLASHGLDELTPVLNETPRPNEVWEKDGRKWRLPTTMIVTTLILAGLIIPLVFSNGPNVPVNNATAPQVVAPSERVPAAMQSPGRVIDKEELADLVKRGRSLLSVEDISSARLLLERAADAQEASAAFDLAGTYDPAVLGRSRAPGVAPDLAMARLWYEKALKLGYSEAERRLAQMQR
jgi:hypothetical protein